MPCTLIKACQDEAVNSKDKHTNRTEDGNLATGSGGPVRRTTRRLGDEHVAWTRRWIPKSNSQQRLDSSDASPDVKSRVGARTIRSVAVHSPTIPTPSTPAAARSVIHPGIVADVPSSQRERQVHWGSVEHGYADGLHQHVVTPSDNHELSRCVEAQPIFELKGEALSVFPQSVVNCPFELHREDKIPGFAVMIRERGIWPRRCPFSVFLSPVGAKDRSHEFRAAGRDTLLGGIIAQISDLVDFIHHHAWFEGDEVTLSREDRLCLLGNLSGRTPKKRRATRSSSGQVFSNVASSFPVETEQHELEPEEVGTDAMDRERK